MASKPLKLSGPDAKVLGWTFIDLLVAFLLTFGVTHVVPFLEDLDSGWGALAATALTLVIQTVRRFIQDTRPTIDERTEVERQGIRPK